MTTLPAAAEHAVEPFALLRHATQPVLTQLRDTYGISPEDVLDIYPCLHTQAYLLLQSFTEKGANVRQTVYQLPSHVSKEVFKSAWEHTIATTDILRTEIFSLKDRLWQVLVNKPVHWGHAEDLQQYMKQDCGTAFSFGEPLARYAMVPTVKGTYFVWTLSHSLYDGWSIPLIWERFEDALTALLSEREAALRPAPLRKLVAWHESQAVEAQDDYWRSELEGWNSTPLPAPQSLHHCQATESTELPGSLPVNPGHSAATMVRAAWSLVLAGWTNARDVTFGMFLAGRSVPVPGIEQLVAPALALVPVRVNLNKSMTVQSLLESLHQQATHMIPYEHLGIQNIRKLSSAAQEACAFQTLLVIHPPESSGTFKSRTGIEWLDVRGFHPYALVLEAMLNDQNDKKFCTLRVSWDARACSTAQATGILHQVQATLHSLSVLECPIATVIQNLDIPSA